MTPTTRIPVERRFPVSLTHSIDSIRDLYNVGKDARWNPQSDISWDAFSTENFTEEALAAARLTWSRRAWIEYVGLYETPALLVRLCLEAGRESDPKYFLTVRNTEEGWQIESFHAYAKLLGGYIDRPPSPQAEAVINQHRHRQILDAEQHSDAFLVVHAAIEDGLELELFRAYLDNATEPVARQILEKSVEAKTRHAAFGWAYVAERAELWTDADRLIIATAAHDYLVNTELKGYHCPWLADPDGAEAQAGAATAAAGLGAATPSQEKAIFLAYVAAVRTRLEAFGVHLPLLTDRQLGTF